MRISSRTPEGEPQRCPVCGNEARVETSAVSGDATCPSCGSLLWLENHPMVDCVRARQFNGLVADVLALAVSVLSLVVAIFSGVRRSELIFLCIFLTLLWGKALVRLARALSKRMIAISGR